MNLIFKSSVPNDLKDHLKELIEPKLFDIYEARHSRKYQLLIIHIRGGLNKYNYQDLMRAIKLHGNIEMETIFGDKITIRDAWSNYQVVFNNKWV